MSAFYKFHELGTDENFGDPIERILEQATKAGFSGKLKIYNLGLDTEDSISLSGSSEISCTNFA
jgi:hypothetical protein